MPRPLQPHGRRLQYLLNMRPGGPHSQSGCSGEEKKSTARNETPVVHLVA